MVYGMVPQNNESHGFHVRDIAHLQHHYVSRIYEQGNREHGQTFETSASESFLGATPKRTPYSTVPVQWYKKYARTTRLWDRVLSPRVIRARPTQYV